MEVQGFDFNDLSKEGIAAQKAQAEEEERAEKAEKSVDASMRRKQLMPPTQAELRRMERDRKEVAKEDSAWVHKNKIAKLKATCTRYFNHFNEKYPEFKKLAKPAEKDGLEEWQSYLQNMQDVIGSGKAEQRFHSYLGMAVSGLENVNKAFPELFAGYNIHSPVSLVQVVNSEQFAQQIEDERAEIIFTHQSWFASGYWSRLLENLSKAAMAVALKNKEVHMAAAQSPEVLERLHRGRVKREPGVDDSEQE